MNLQLQSPSPDGLLSLTQLLTEQRKRATESSLKDGHEVVRARCKTLAGFIKAAWPILEPGNEYVPGWHIYLICAHLEAVTSGRLLELGLINRLLINVPPGMMKSLLVSVLWPAWEWGPQGMAYLRYLCASFSEVNNARDCRKMRELIQSDWYQTLWPEVVLTKATENYLENSKLGCRDSSRAMSSLTGGRGDRVILDDPNSTEGAESEAERKKVNRIVRESLQLRVNDSQRSAIIVIQQRLHEADVTGTLKSLDIGYIHIMLPMEFDPSRAFVSPLGAEYSDPRKKDGDLIFEKRFPPEVIARDKIPLGAVGVAGQFQQRPAPRGGLMFMIANFPIIDPNEMPSDVRMVRGWDFAASTETNSAFTCGLKLGRDKKGKFYIIHVIRVRTEDPETVLINTASVDTKAVEIDYPQDPGQAGKVQRISISRRLAGYTFYSSPESGDKIVRARPVVSQSEAGNFCIVRGPWNEQFINELELFPNAAFKDQIDALSRAFGRFVSTVGVSFVSPIIITTPNAAFGDNPNAYVT